MEVRPSMFYDYIKRFIHQLSNAHTKWSIYGIARVVGTSFFGKGKDISNNLLRCTIHFDITDYSMTNHISI